MLKRDRNRDFDVLSKASELILSQLQSDENAPDLIDQVNQQVGFDGNHHYFIEPYLSSDPNCSTWIPPVEYKDFVPFPTAILDERRNVDCASFMGIISTINKAWITVDNKLYLWNILQPEDYELYDGLNEVIVSVALTTPKRGVFNEEVKYLLVVATATQVILLALVQDNNNAKLIRLQTTKYIISSDNITISKIIGTENGRIFLAGDDGNLLEIWYENNQESWTAYLGLEPPYKCRKLKHGNNKLTNYIIPSFVWGIVGADESIVDIVIEGMLKLLYTISSTGSLSVFSLGRNGNEFHQIIPNFNSIFNFNLMTETRDFIISTNGRGGLPDISIFQDLSRHKVISLSVLSPLQSNSIHLIAITSMSVRIYLSVRTADGSPYSLSSSSLPTGIAIVHVRSPPTPVAVDKLIRNEKSSPGESFPPATVPGGLLVGLHCAYCDTDLFLGALNTEKEQTDVLVGMTNDLLCRRTDVDPMLLTITQAAMREAVALVTVSDRTNGKIHDIQEMNLTMTDNYCIPYTDGNEASTPPSSSFSSVYLASLYILSKTPKDYNILAGEVSRGPSSTSPSTSSDRSKTYISSNGSSSNMNRFSITSEIIPITYVSSQLKKSSTTIGGNITLESMISSSLTSLQPQRQPQLQQQSSSIIRHGELAYQSSPLTSAPQKKYLFLTSTGVHSLAKNRPIDILFHILSQHTSGEEFTMQTNTFFQKFGALQFATMCLSVACGLPGDLGITPAAVTLATNGLRQSTSPMKQTAKGHVPDLVRRRAIILMLRLCGQPAFKSGFSPFAGVAATGGITDHRAVYGQRFVYSMAHDGINIFLSRLLRPIWYKVMVSLNTSRATSAAANQSNSTKSVSLLLTRDEIFLIRLPLLRLQAIFLDFFSAAVAQNSYLPPGPDSGIYGDGIPTQILGSESLGRSGVDDSKWGDLARTDFRGSITARQLDSLSASQQKRDPILEAQRIEESSLNMMYRLLVRSIQCLSLLELLITAQVDYAVPISWSYLSGSTFSTLVTSSTAHENIRHLITDILNQPPSIVSHAVADQILAQLCRDSFQFFSSGDRCAYEAIKYLANAMSYPKESHDRIENTRLGVGMWMQASSYWTASNYVEGESSDLAQACKKLRYSCDTGRMGIVDLCLNVAKHFTASSSDSRPSTSTSQQGIPSLGRNRSSSSTSITIPGGSTSKSTSGDWERQLYHDTTVDNEDAKAQALLSVYRCLLHEVNILRSLRRLGAGVLPSEELTVKEAEDSCAHMIRRILESTTDNVLHEELYKQLLEEDLDMVLSIRSSSVEAFLRINKPHLLYNYLERHNDHSRACLLAEELALGPNHELTLDQRVDMLVRAVSSASAACQDTKYGMEMDSNVSRLQELQELLEVAGLQQRTLSVLSLDLAQAQTSLGTSSGNVTEASRKSLHSLEDVVNELRSKLVDINFLYNKAAFPYRLWDICLAILGLAKEDNSATVLQLWRSCIYRLVPTVSLDTEISVLLRERRRIGNVLEDKRRQRSDVPLEDTTTWMTDVADLVSSLGNRLLQTQGDHGGVNVLAATSSVFPLSAIIEELQELSAILAADAAVVKHKRGWPASCVLQVHGTNYKAIIDCYFDISRRWTGRKAERLIVMLWDISITLEEWVRSATSTNIGAISLIPNSDVFPTSSGQGRVSGEVRSFEHHSFQQSLRDGRLREFLDWIQQTLAALSVRPLSTQERVLMSETRDSIEVVERVSLNLTLVTS